VRDTQSLVAVHKILQEAFGWRDDHLYAFWLDGEFWGDEATEYGPPGSDEPVPRDASVRLGRLGLEPGRRIAYVFDFGDEWRVALTYVGEADVAAAPTVLERRGDAPPQYPDYADDEDE
jgi:hypothetical protein